MFFCDNLLRFLYVTHFHKQASFLFGGTSTVDEYSDLCKSGRLFFLGQRLVVTLVVFQSCVADGFCSLLWSGAASRSEASCIQRCRCNTTHLNHPALLLLKLFLKFGFSIQAFLSPRPSCRFHRHFQVRSRVPLLPVVDSAAESCSAKLQPPRV